MKKAKRTARTDTENGSALYNAISYVGWILAAFGFVVGISLILLDMQSHFENPYLGIFTYMVVPGIIITGLLLVLAGVLITRRRMTAGLPSAARLPVIDLRNRRHFTATIVVATVTLLFVVLSAVGSYRAYHFTESVVFCGETCHSVMKPEYTAYQLSPHANTGCTDCHIGPGADFFVKSKLNGLRQVVATMTESYSRPIPTPVHNLRPAKETCNTCHWPAKFFGSVELNRTYYRGDEDNTPWSIRMLIKVGGGDTRHGRAQGIHWHMAVKNKIEYIAADEKRLEIPWVRVTHPDGSQTIYQTTNKRQQLSEADIASAEVRVMDCIDCHNRPTHQFLSPERAMNEVMHAGRIDATIPSIKANAIELLTAEYATESEALQAIQDGMKDYYPEGGAAVAQATLSVQNVFKQNFFPEMKVDWRAYPDHIGHQISPGCFRCHNGDHEDPEGNAIRRDCNLCHTIIAQGPGMELASVTSGGLDFEHPEDIDQEWKESRCDDCHEGVPVY